MLDIIIYFYNHFICSFHNFSYLALLFLSGNYPLLPGSLQHYHFWIMHICDFLYSLYSIDRRKDSVILYLLYEQSVNTELLYICAFH